MSNHTHDKITDIDESAGGIAKATDKFELMRANARLIRINRELQQELQAEKDRHARMARRCYEDKSQIGKVRAALSAEQRLTRKLKATIADLQGKSQSIKKYTTTKAENKTEQASHSAGSARTNGILARALNRVYGSGA